jgi:hypothetical protein
MRSTNGIAACVIGLVAQFSGQAPAHGQLSLVFGGAIVGGTLQTPYSVTCGAESATAAVGSIAHAGVGFKVVSLTAGYVTVNGWSEDCLISLPPADGVYRIREYNVTHSAVYGWAFHLRYSPDSLPFMAYAGTGIRFGGNELGHNRFLSVGAALRTPGRLSLFAGGELTQLRTHFVDFERTWQNGEMMSSTEVDRGLGWRKMKLIRFGLEYRWKLLGGV